MKGLSPKCVDTILSSWRSGTKSCYTKYLNQWTTYASAKNVDPSSPPDAIALAFLQGLYENGESYGQINTACSAMSTIIDTPSNISFGKLPLVKRFKKGVYQSKPTFPRYNFVWDVNKVFNFFRQLPEVAKLSLKLLSLKLAMLLMLLSGGQRSQTIHCLQREDIHIIDETTLYIPVMAKIKQTKPGMHMKPLKFKAYVDKKLCVLAHLTEYISRTEKLVRNEPNLFISYIKPHKAVTKDTIARWCKCTLALSGIDISKYSTHSSRSAASSKAKEKGIAVNQIIDSAGWSNEQTFAKFYERPIESDNILNEMIN